MTDFLDRLERQLIDATYAPPGKRASATGRGRPWRTPLIASVLILASATIALAASGLLSGSPVSPAGPLNPTVGEGIPAPGGSRLLSIRVSDPNGGPPWGMRIVHTTRGDVCLQVGRVQSGQLGEIGVDGAFHDDGRFHPLPADVLPADTGLGLNTTCAVTGQTFTVTVEAIDRSDALLPPHASVPPARYQRTISYGMLGAHAQSITYTTAHGTRTAPVIAGSGTYLVVGPIEHGAQFQATGGSNGVDQLHGDRPGPNFALTAITYRFGTRVCSDSRTPNVAPACPRPSMSGQPPSPARELHQRLHVTLTIRHHLVYGAQLRFTAPYTVTSSRDDYTIEIHITPGCHGPNGATVVGSLDRNVVRGATVRYYIPYPFIYDCGRPLRVDVTLPALHTDVGTITIPEPPGTHPARPPTPHHSN